MNLDELKVILKENGIVGAGGAGFPTYAKLNSKADVLIMNCAECEPLIRVDRQLIKIYTEEILDTYEMMVQVLGCEKGIIGIKSHYKESIEAIKHKIENYPKLELNILEDVYPAGDEVVLIYETTGRIVPEGAIPITVGAIVVNVETVLNIHNAVVNKKAVVDTYVTITGEVNNPITVKAPIGSKVIDLINLAGGSKIEDYEIIMGGPMTGRLTTLNSYITKTTKALIVLPKEHLVINKRKFDPSIDIKRAMSVCSQCRMCSDLCPRNQLGHVISPHKIMNTLANGLTEDIDTFTSTMLCCECGICEMYACHQGLAPRSLIAEMKLKLREKGIKNPHNNAPINVGRMREYRKIPIDRLIAKLNLTTYNVDANLSPDRLKVKKVEINMRQHIGAPAVPIVKVGDEVYKGNVIGIVDEKNLGAFIHASITGVIVSVSENSIFIEARGDING
ncbi:4Fe-4S dicluster domain-containing protein [Clostridium grantii]|uniref:Na+-translocating ferredoxin:NAD+ oxidoreductase RNF, RnfC subunit n=1 Tax=Clostridium grantii DSM 8605 TaxID=1121316 RepID=A0A1M5SXN5_9CLOT|nr:4Fe-4S dicluster domain-containing protein [Clostridium grantii]SHH43252.1 Na+-translocating ferredoxin:NAD+ oxidoreductase RNF, RnfC subunit [Clostridium grantii DSM 8605]